MIILNSSIKARAISLRESGETYRQVSRTLNTPLSTIHLWTKSIKLTEEQKQQIKTLHQKALTEGRIRTAHQKKQKTAIVRLKNFDVGTKLVGKKVSDRELLLIGASLYWGEGFKKDSRLGFANSDPQMIKLFLDWLIKIGKVPKIDIRLRVGVNTAFRYNVDAIEQKWSKITKISLSQFQKPFFQKTKHKRKYPINSEYLGVLRIRANNQTRLFHKILGMMSALKNLAG